MAKRTQRYCSTACSIKQKNQNAKKYKVPVVSFEWLEKYCQENNWHGWKEQNDGICRIAITVTNLLLAAKKESEK